MDNVKWQSEYIIARSAFLFSLLITIQTTIWVGHVIISVDHCPKAERDLQALAWSCNHPGQETSTHTARCHDITPSVHGRICTENLFFLKSNKLDFFVYSSFKDMIHIQWLLALSAVSLCMYQDVSSWFLYRLLSHRFLIVFCPHPALLLGTTYPSQF